MVTPQAPQFGTYRCPVCGHRDGAELHPGHGPGRISCSYCGSALEISATDPGSHGFVTQLAQVPAHG